MRRLTLILTGMMLCAGTAFGAEEWNAVAFDKQTLTVGFARDAHSKDDALQKAVAECRRAGAQHCNLTHAEEGGCVAISRSQDRRSIGIGMDTTLKEAVSEALKECRNDGKHIDCTLHTNFCVARDT